MWKSRPARTDASLRYGYGSIILAPSQLTGHWFVLLQILPSDIRFVAARRSSGSYADEACSDQAS